MNLPPEALTVSQHIRFAHSDPARIVYYPEYLRMFDDLFDDWMSESLGLPYADLLMNSDQMFPLLHLDVDFKQARRMGQTVDFTFILTHVGRASFRYTIVAHDAGVECLRANFVSCSASKASEKSVPIPDDIRAKMLAYLDKCAGWSG